MSQISTFEQKFCFIHTNINNNTIRVEFTQHDNLMDLLEKFKGFLSLCEYEVENKHLVLLTEEQINQIDN